MSFTPFSEEIRDELRFIRRCTVVAGVVALLAHETGAAFVAVPLYLLVGVVERIFRHPAIVY